MVTALDISASDNAESLRKKAQPVIEEATRRLVAEFAPEQVWLFGSYAWGEPTEDSDLDLLLVVLDDGDTSIHGIRRARRCLRSIDMAKDILIQSISVFNRFKPVRSSLSHKIAAEGRLLYSHD